MKQREKKKAETSERLIAVARKTFFENGFAGTSMDDLCAEAGVTRGALYHNFGSKEGLFEAVVRQIDHEIGEQLLKVAEGDSSFDAFKQTCLAYVTIATDPEVQAIVFKDGPAVLGQRLRQIDQDGSVEPLRQAIADLQREKEIVAGDPAALSILLNGAMIDAALWIAENENDETAVQKASHALSTMIDGLRINRAH